MTLLRSFFLAVATAATTACGGSGPSLPNTDADFSGTLSKFVERAGQQSEPRPLLVERQTPSGTDPRIVHVEPGTRVYRVERGGQLVPASADDLAVGDQLQVWTTGVELRSYPGQVFAVRIHIHY